MLSYNISHKIFRYLHTQGVNANIPYFLSGQIRWHQESHQGCLRGTHEGDPGIHRGPGRCLNKSADRWNQSQCTITISLRTNEHGLISLLLLFVGGVHRFQRRYPLLHLWCRCWHCPQWSLCEAGHMVGFHIWPHTPNTHTRVHTHTHTHTHTLMFILF